MAILDDYLQIIDESFCDHLQVASKFRLQLDELCFQPLDPLQPLSSSFNPHLHHMSHPRGA